ncbi:MAG: hypothetical protein U0P82_08735 [Vicinamibacterales bacterium]
MPLGRCRSRLAAALLCAALPVWWPGVACGQTTAHGALGAGATQGEVGVEVVRGRAGAGAVGGVGAVLLGSIFGSYGLLRSGRPVDVRLTAGVTVLSSSEVSSKGLEAGVNTSLWVTRHLALYGTGARYLRIHETRSVQAPGYRYNVPYWRAAAGIAVRLR